MASPSMEQRLSRFWLFDGFAPDEWSDIAQAVQEKTYRSGQFLFNQGDLPGFFYLIERGSVDLVGRDPAGQVNLRRHAEAGEFVGHRALLHNTHRQATATVARDSVLLAIEAVEFQALLAAYPTLRERLLRIRAVNRLLATPLFSSYTRDQLFHVADLAHAVEYPAGQIIFRQNEIADAFYVIDTGQVEESITGAAPGGGSWPKYLTAGSFFGRSDLLNRTPRRATAQAVTDVQLFRFNADAFHWLGQLQPAFHQALVRPDVLGYLQSMTIFSNLEKAELKQLAGHVGLAHYPAGEIVYRQGEVDPTLYILYEGEAVLRARDEQGRERPRGYLRPGEAVGETALFLPEPRDVTIEPVVDTNWFYLTRQDLNRFLSEYPNARDKLVLKPEVKVRRRLSRFPWMDEDEVIMMRRRRHWFFLVNRLIIPFVLLGLALVLLMLRLPAGISLFIAAITVLWTLWRIADWGNDYYLVTDKRVAHREKVLMIRETRDETPLNKIQNVNVRRGLFGNLFGYGTLIIDTAAAAGVTRVTFNYLGNPDAVRDLIFEQVSRVQAGERSQTRRAIRKKLEANMGTSIRPEVPQPAIPGPETDAPPPPSAPGILERTFEFVLGKRFWIERRSDDRVTWRKHWIRLLTKIWMPLLVFATLLLVMIFVVTQMDKSWPFVLVLAPLLALAFGWLWWQWTNWGNDQYIVTTDRLIDIEALPLGFASKRTETTFDRIQNVSYEIPSPIATLLNYGTVEIFTAGTEGRLDFVYVRNPKGVQAEIFRRLTAYEARQRHQDREQRWEDLPDWFASYEEMHRPS